MSEEKCAPVLKKFQSMSTNVSNEENIEEGLRKFCWFVFFLYIRLTIIGLLSSLIPNLLAFAFYKISNYIK
jgi:hypothetical protein